MEVGPVCSPASWSEVPLGSPWLSRPQALKLGDGCPRGHWALRAHQLSLFGPPLPPPHLVGRAACASHMLYLLLSGAQSASTDPRHAAGNQWSQAIKCEPSDSNGIVPLKAILCPQRTIATERSIQTDARKNTPSSGWFRVDLPVFTSSATPNFQLFCTHVLPDICTSLEHPDYFQK